MSYQRSKTPTTAPLQTPAAPQSAPEVSPLLGLQSAVGNAGVLDLLRPQMPGATPSPVQPQTPRTSSWWDEAVDTTVSGVGGLVDGGVHALSDVPLLSAAAATMAPVTKFAWETLGGFAKGGGDLVGGLVHMGLHPIDTMMGIGTMLEHIPFSPLKTLHHVYDIAAGNKTFEDVYWKNPLDYAYDELSEDGAFWGQVLGGIAAPYKESMAEGKHGEALGRGIFDVGSLLMGVGEARALGKGAEAVNVLDHSPIANKVDDAVKLASKGKELGAAGEDLAQAGGKADEVTKTAIRANDVTDLGALDNSTLASGELGKASQWGTPDRVNLDDAGATTAAAGRDAEGAQAAAPAAEPRRSATPEDYKRIGTKAEVPEHYSSDPRFDDLSADPDHAGMVTDKSVKEAMTGLEAERQGLVMAPIERGPKGIEFYDAEGTPYDVKTPPSPAPDAPFKFKPPSSGSSVLKQVRKTQPNKLTGQNEFVRVLLDTSYMTTDDLAALHEWLQANAAPEELERIIELSVQL